MKWLRPETLQGWFLTVFCLFLALKGRAGEPDFTVVPGRQVGAITRSTSLAQLKKLYGADKVKDTVLPGAEGETIPGAVVAAGTDRELHVIWHPDKPGQEVFHVDLIGKAWTVGDHLKVGAGLADVEKANGGPFKISGFEWDLGGYADFSGGRLEATVMVRFMTTVDTLPESVLGDRQLSTSSKILRGVKPVVQSVSVILK